jgi:hypothetical protein
MQADAHLDLGELSARRELTVLQSQSVTQTQRPPEGSEVRRLKKIPMCHSFQILKPQRELPNIWRTISASGASMLWDCWSLPPY